MPELSYKAVNSSVGEAANEFANAPLGESQLENPQLSDRTFRHSVQHQTPLSPRGMSGAFVLAEL